MSTRARADTSRAGAPGAAAPRRALEAPGPPAPGRGAGRAAPRADRRAQRQRCAAGAVPGRHRAPPDVDRAGGRRGRARGAAADRPRRRARHAGRVRRAAVRDGRQAGRARGREAGAARGHRPAGGCRNTSLPQDCRDHSARSRLANCGQQPWQSILHPTSSSVQFSLPIHRNTGRRPTGSDARAGIRAAVRGRRRDAERVGEPADRHRARDDLGQRAGPARNAGSRPPQPAGPESRRTHSPSSRHSSCRASSRRCCPRTRKPSSARGRRARCGSRCWPRSSGRRSRAATRWGSPSGWRRVAATPWPAPSPRPRSAAQPRTSASLMSILPYIQSSAAGRRHPGR